MYEQLVSFKLRTLIGDMMMQNKMQEAQIEVHRSEIAALRAEIEKLKKEKDESDTKRNASNGHDVPDLAIDEPDYDAPAEAARPIA